MLISDNLTSRDHKRRPALVVSFRGTKIEPLQNGKPMMQDDRKAKF